MARAGLWATDWKLELVFVPVSDVDRAKDFYVNKVGFIADYDERPMDGIRFVQLTPPGSGCSIAIGEGLNDAPPGTAPSLQLVVSDIEAAHKQLKDNGVDVSDVDVQDWGHFVYFADPDGPFGFYGYDETTRCCVHGDESLLSGW